MKKWLAVLLAGVMTFSLAACGDGGQTTNSGGSTTDTADTGKTSEAAGQEAKQHIYQYEDLALDDILQGASVRTLAYLNDKVYALFDCWGETQYTALYSANVDGTDAKTTALASLELSDGSSAYTNSAEITEDGSIYIVQSISELVDADNYVYSQKMNLQCYDLDGNQLWSQPFLEEASAADNYINILAIGSRQEGGAELLAYDSNSNIYSMVVTDADGKQVKNQEIGDGSSLNLNSAISNEDGTWKIFSYNSDYTALKVSTYDVASNSMGEQSAAPLSITNYTKLKGLDGRLLLAGENGVAVWNWQDEKETVLMNSVDSDLNAGSISYAAEISDTQFVGAYNDMNDQSIHIAVFTKVNPEDVPDRETLVLGGFYLGSDIKSKIIEFNKNNSAYKITVKDYSTYSTTGSVEDFITQMNNDILAGNMPDILKVSEELQLGNLVKKGLLVNIDELIAGDSELSQAAFLDNVFEAYRIDGKLYQVIPFFNVSTFVGKKSILGDITGWNMEEFMNYASTLKDGQSMFGEVTRDAFLTYALQFGSTDYIDTNSGECHFDSDEFVNVLTYAATLPKEITYEDDYDWTEYANQYRTGKTVLMPMYMSNFSNLTSAINGSFGEEITYVGFPASNQNGSSVIATESYVISAKSAHQDAAWEFVRTFLTSDYQNSEDVYGMPVEKNAFMAMANKALEKPYYLDEKGQKVEYDETFYLNDEEIVLPTLTEEQLNQAVSFVEGITKAPYQNSEIMSIINEEVQAFFEGQKSAKDVASVIQNRVQLYLDENY